MPQYKYKQRYKIYAKATEAQKVPVQFNSATEFMFFMLLPTNIMNCSIKIYFFSWLIWSEMDISYATAKNKLDNADKGKIN